MKPARVKNIVEIPVTKNLVESISRSFNFPVIFRVDSYDLLQLRPIERLSNKRVIVGISFLADIMSGAVWKKL